ncbi:UNVERIFIED_CONTAM: hypothetical protein Slati_4410000 [Sesamum latifolium]|uniref:Reverse transcriptase Ty1/copia-type domain-containing protein n=1 Tax=Sesamum latifolium TaxID=2727402 RepID=A0AAW2SPT8_9LAMI
MLDIDSDKWLEAMKSEMHSMGSNQVWTLVDPPKGVRPVGCNRSTNVSLELTVRLRPSRQGSWQRDILNDLGSTLKDLFASSHGQVHSDTACHSSMRSLWISRRVSLLEKNRRFCRLQRSIYGLKQASRSWNTRFDEVIRGYDFIKNDCDPCIYKKISGSSVAYLVLYVDDILLIGNDVKMLRDIKAWLSTQFP